MSPAPRQLVDGSGRRWVAVVISHGRTSGYLNPRVHRPIVEFACLDQPQPRRYARLPQARESLEELADDELMALLGEAKTH